MYINKVELKYVVLDKVAHIADACNDEKRIGIILDARVFFSNLLKEYLVTFSPQETYWLREDEIEKI